MSSTDLRDFPIHQDDDDDDGVAEIEDDDAKTFGGKFDFTSGIGDKKKPNNVTEGRKNQQCRS